MLLKMKQDTNVHCRKNLAQNQNIFAVVPSFLHVGFSVQRTVFLGILFVLIWIRNKCLDVSKKVKKLFDNFSERARDVEVLVGTNKLSSGGTRYSTNKIFIHENYTRSNYANDIALLRVQTPIEFSEKVQPIKISSKVIEPGTQNLKITGFGLLSVNVSKLSELHLVQNNFHIQKI